METPQSANNALRKGREDLTTTREWLGKPVFKDQKKGRQQAFKLVSMTMRRYLQDGGKFIEEEMRNVINSHHNEQFKITPAYIALQHCFSLSEQIQRRGLQALAGDKKENRPIEIATLDVIKGFQQVLLVMTSIYGPSSLDNSESSQVRTLREWVRHTGFTTEDPKGFSLMKDQSKFWGSQTEGRFIKSYEDPKLIADGARLAVKIYKRMYPIAEKVLSSGS